MDTKVKMYQVYEKYYNHVQLLHLLGIRAKSRITVGLDNIHFQSSDRKDRVYFSYRVELTDEQLTFVKLSIAEIVIKEVSTSL